MKNLNIFSIAVLLSCGFLSLSCEKQSDGVMPTPKAAAASVDSKPDVPSSGVKVGDKMLASEYRVGSAPGTLVDLVCTKAEQTGSGSIATWQSYNFFTGVLSPAAITAYPLTGVPYTFFAPYQNVLSDGVNYEISRKTTWDAYGNVTLQEKVNRNKVATN